MRALLVSVLLAAFCVPQALVAADPLDPCDSAGQVALHRIEITPGRADGTVYVDDENYALGNGVWIYQETNGVWAEKAPGVYLEGLSKENLQRGGGPFIFASPRDHNEPDICSDDPSWLPDTMIL